MATSHSIIEPFPDHIDRDGFGHWLSGFADGEATFGLRPMRMNRGRRVRVVHYYASFRISLRDDDEAVLRLIQSYWSCGTFHRADNSRSKVPNAKPVIIFNVARVSDLFGIVIPHFDRYPLRAKKQEDFRIWRQGVELMMDVQNRPQRGVRGRSYTGGGRGTVPKWTESELEQVKQLSLHLINQRKYGNGVHSACPPAEPKTMPLCQQNMML